MKTILFKTIAISIISVLYILKVNAVTNMDYLCFTADSIYSTIMLNRIGSPYNIYLEYSFNGIDWNNYNFGNTITLTNVGDKVYFKNAEDMPVAGFSTGSQNYYSFSMTGKIAASGNIMSLVDKTCETNTIPCDYCFYKLFENCSSLTATPKTPATNLKGACYAYMFNKCNSIKTPNELPATKLADVCYYCMFTDCTSLTTAPELPATKLTYRCYFGMLAKCTSLTTAPELPAAELEEMCYYDMFSGCTNLNKIKVGFTDWRATGATLLWLNNVSPTGIFICPKELDTTGIDRNDCTIPMGWTVINSDEKLAFEEYKTAKKADADNLIKDGDSQVIHDLVSTAKSDIDALDYDESKLLTDNKANIDAIITKLIFNINVQHETEGQISEIPNNEIWYTSSDGKVITPDISDDFGANIISNTYSNGKGVIVFDNSVTSIGDGAFWGRSGLTSITIPNSVTSIGGSAFGSCSGLASITIPNSITSIGDRAFEFCSGLTSITIPNSVTSIVDETFCGCSGLTSITVESSNSNYDSRDNCNAIIETATNTLIAGCKNTVIPNSVTSIGLRAFQYCSGLTSITIPNSVTSIGSRAFLCCSGLTSITIPNSVTSIVNETFCGCSGLTSITIPNSVTSIGFLAFDGCSGLTSITIPNSVTSIGGGAFEGCIYEA